MPGKRQALLEKEDTLKFGDWLRDKVDQFIKSSIIFKILLLFIQCR